MKRSAFLLSCVLIIVQYCFTTTSTCDQVENNARKSISDLINGWRKKNGAEEITILEADPIVLEAIERHKVDTAKSAFLLYEYDDHNLPIGNDEEHLVAIVQEWIDSGKDYKPGQPLTQAMWPFARLIWKETRRAECAVCLDDSIENGKSKFACKFFPRADLTDESKLKSNLPSAEVKTADKPGDDSSSSPFSEYEQTVRKLALISSIATITIVALGFIITLLVAIKICTR